jgi:hypothetical protein
MDPRIRIHPKMSWIRNTGSESVPDPNFHFDEDPDTDPGFQKKAQNLKEALKQVHIPYILACHLQIDAYPDPDPVITLMRIRIQLITLMRIRILSFNLMRIHVEPDTQHWLTHTQAQDTGLEESDKRGAGGRKVCTVLSFLKRRTEQVHYQIYPPSSNRIRHQRKRKKSLFLEKFAFLSIQQVNEFLFFRIFCFG